MNNSDVGFPKKSYRYKPRWFALSHAILSVIPYKLKLSCACFKSWIHQNQRDVFPFSAVSVCNSTITFYAVVVSEILHFARITSSKEKFQKLKTTLLTRLHRQGSQNTQLKQILNKLFGKPFEYFKRFADAAKSFTQLYQLI